jgi:uncharacterized protein YhfF
MRPTDESLRLQYVAIIDEVNEAWAKVEAGDAAISAWKQENKRRWEEYRSLTDSYRQVGDEFRKRGLRIGPCE